MDRFNLPCTEEQVKKALKLGAPIKTRSYRFDDHSKDFFAEDGKGYFIPTAEQMINWLEDGVFKEVKVQEFANYWEYYLFTSSDDIVSHKNHFRSRKEATIAAIDAALEYLTNQKISKI